MMNQGPQNIDWKLLMSLLGGQSGQSTLGQTPVGPQNFGGANVASQQGMGYAPGAEPSVAETAGQDPNAEMMKMLKQYLMQSQGNKFYNPFQKGPDIWGGLQGMAQNIPQGMLGKLLGLGK